MENSAGARSGVTASVHPIGSQPGITGDRRIQMDYAGLAQGRLLDGHVLTEAEGLAILATPDEELLEQMAAAYRIRRHYSGNRVHLHFLINAKSGLCPEDCSYCSQSRVSRAEIPKYNLLEPGAVAGRGTGRRQAQAPVPTALSSRPAVPMNGSCARWKPWCRRSSVNTASASARASGCSTTSRTPPQSMRRGSHQPQCQHQRRVLRGDLYHAQLS